MARTASMTPEEAIAEIGIARGSLLVLQAKTHLPTLKKYLTACGAIGAYANRCPFWLAMNIYNDTSDKLLADYIAQSKAWAAKSATTATPAPITPAPVAPSVPPAIATALAAEFKEKTATPVATPEYKGLPEDLWPPKTPVTTRVEKTETKTIVTVSPGSIDTKSWDSILASLKANKAVPGIVHRVLLYGPPRTGKSTGAAQIFAPAERITFHKQMPVDDLLGGYCLRDGTTVWVDGPAVRAMKNGSTLVIDEIDQMSPEIRFTFHAIADDPPGVTLASGERVTAAPGFTIVATSNALPGTLPPPVVDRFDIILYCNTLSHGLKERLGTLASAAQRSVLDTKQWVRPASPNLYLAAAKLLQGGMSHEQVASVLYPTDKTARADLLALLATAKL